MAPDHTFVATPSATRQQIEAFIQSKRLPAEVGQQLLSSLDHIVTVREGVASGGPCQPDL